MGYKNPLLVEIFSELRFATGTLPSARLVEIVGAVGQKFKGTTEFAQLLTATSEQTGVRPNIAPSLRYWSPDKTTLFQFSEDLVVVNQLRRYEGWSGFVQLFRTVTSILATNLGELSIASLSLNCIDKLEVEVAGFALGEYLECRGPHLPDSFADAREPFDIVTGRGIVSLNGSNRQIRATGRVEQAKFIVQLETKIERRVESSAKLFDVLEDLHDESNATFEDLITDRTRRLMGGAQ